MLGKSKGSPPIAARAWDTMPVGVSAGPERAPIAEGSAERMRNESISDRLHRAAGGSGVALLFDAELLAARTFAAAAGGIPGAAREAALAGADAGIPGGADFPGGGVPAGGHRGDPARGAAAV